MFVKLMRGVDATMRGKCDLSIGFDPNRLDAHDLVGTIDQTTFGLGYVPLIGAGSRVSLTPTSRGKGPHRLGSLALHYDGGEDVR